MSINTFEVYNGQLENFAKDFQAKHNLSVPLDQVVKAIQEALETGKAVTIKIPENTPSQLRVSSSKTQGESQPLKIETVQSSNPVRGFAILLAESKFSSSLERIEPPPQASENLPRTEAQVSTFNRTEDFQISPQTEKEGSQHYEEKGFSAGSQLKKFSMEEVIVKIRLSSDEIVIVDQIKEVGQGKTTKTFEEAVIITQDEQISQKVGKKSYQEKITISNEKPPPEEKVFLQRGKTDNGSQTAKKPENQALIENSRARFENIASPKIEEEVKPQESCKESKKNFDTEKNREQKTCDHKVEGLTGEIPKEEKEVEKVSNETIFKKEENNSTNSEKKDFSTEQIGEPGNKNSQNQPTLMKKNEVKVFETRIQLNGVNPKNTAQTKFPAEGFPPQGIETKSEENRALGGSLPNTNQSQQTTKQNISPSINLFAKEQIRPDRNSSSKRKKRGPFSDQYKIEEIESLLDQDSDQEEEQKNRYQSLQENEP